MRKSIAAVAAIQREDETGTLWLARWNAKWQCYHFISGHKRPGESFRECIVREVREELHLSEGTDFRVGDDPLARVEYEGWSRSARAETIYTMELFEVKVTGTSAWKTLDADAKCRWLTKAEIQAQKCKDGKPVSSTAELLLSKLG